MNYMFKGPTAEMKVSGWQLPTLRAAMIFRQDEQPAAEQRCSDMILGQVQKAAATQDAAYQDHRIKLDGPACDALDRSLGQLKTNPNWQDTREQEAISGLQNQLSWARPGNQKADNASSTTGAKARLEARLSQGPDEPRLPGMERPFQLKMMSARTKAAGRGM